MEQSEYCPYRIPANFSWVRGARGLLRAPLPVPLLAPYGDFAAAVAEATGVEIDSKKSNIKTPPPPLRLAALDDTMEASRSGAKNSSHCLRQGTCGPIGGYSVWAALPAMPRSKNISASTPSPPLGGGDGPEPEPEPTPPPPPPEPTPAPPSPTPTPTPPPSPPNSSVVARTVVLAAAADSRQLLHGGTAGAGALSGLVALLAAAEALGNATRSFSSSSPSSSSPVSNSTSPAPFPGRILFVALAAEPWGFLGSRRLLWEARGNGGSGEGGSGKGEEGEKGKGQDDGAGGFPLGDVSWLIELGSVGDGSSPTSGADNSSRRLFAHPGTTEGSREGPAAALLLLNGPSPAAPVVAIPDPSAAGGGSPPGSLWAWAAAAPNVSSALLSAHERSLGGAHSSSRWDDARRLDPGAVAAAAAVAASAAAAGAGASSDFLSLSPNANASSAGSPPFLSAEAVLPRVLELISCLVARDPGLGGGDGEEGKDGKLLPPCRLSLELLGARGTAEARSAAIGGGGTPHHAGPLATLTADPQSFDPLSKTPYARFLWEFLAGATREEEKGEGEKKEVKPCERDGGGKEKSCPAGSVCARRSSTSSTPSSPLSCVRASVAFVAAYPLNLECSGCDGAENYGNWQALPEAAPGGDDKNQTQPQSSPVLRAAAAADAWRRSLGWPEEPLWAESSWEEGVPRLLLWRTSALSSTFTLLLLWGAAAAASAGVLFVAAAAKRGLELTRWEESLGYEEAAAGGDSGSNDQGFVPSF